MCGRQLITRQDFLRAALTLAAAPLLRSFPARADDAAEASEIAPGIFVHQGRYEVQSPDNRGDMANASFVVGNECVAVIDTLGSAVAGRELLAAIRAATNKPIRYVINTHMHPDHVFGNAAFRAGGPHLRRPLQACARPCHARRSLPRHQQGDAWAQAFEGIEIILPTLKVEDKTSLDLGGRTLILEPQRTAHTDNDLTITDPATNTLFLGDLLFSVHVPTLDGSIKGWLALIEELKTSDAARVVPGHGPQAMELPEAFDPEEQYLADIGE